MYFHIHKNIMFTEENDLESEPDTPKTKKTIKKRKVVDVVYLNDLSTEHVVKTLKQKIREKYRQGE